LGAGGAIYVVGGNLTLESCTFEANGAQGGNGSANPSSETGGGGGGLAGNGGPRFTFAGGGGGGSRGDGAFGGGGTVTNGTDNGGGFSCGGDGGGSIQIDGEDGGCPGGGGGGGGESITIFTSGGDGGNGAYGGGGGGGGPGEDDGSGGNSDFGGGGGSGGTIKSSIDGLGPGGGDGGFGGGGGAAIGGIIGGPGRGGNFGGNAGKSGGGGGAALGGAIFNDSGQVQIYNSTFTGNFVNHGLAEGGGAQDGTDAGGAIFSRAGSLGIFNSTIDGNEATGALGGVVIISDGMTSNFELRNTIVANNGEKECASSGVSLTKTGSGNLIIKNDTDGMGVALCPGVVSSADPQLGPLQTNPPGSTPTMAIDSSSSAFDAGDDAHCQRFDQRGVARPQFMHCDIGAYEFAVCSGLSCPADFTQPNDPGQCGAVVNYSTTGVGDGCGTMTCSVPSGSFFPVGTTPVTCSSTAGPSCSFNVTVNDTENPTVTPPANIMVGNTPGQCSASVDPGTATAGDNCPDATVSGVRNDGQPLNAPYPVGTTTITWTATDAAGNSSAPAMQTVTVKDAQPPSVTNVSVSPAVLRPPNHTYRAVTINYHATDNCSAVTCTLSVRTSDSDKDDYSIIDAHHVRLQAEPSRPNRDRVYTIIVTCRDSAGNITTKTTRVIVPK
jgi:HYR domain